MAREVAGHTAARLARRVGCCRSKCSRYPHAPTASRGSRGPKGIGSQPFVPRTEPWGHEPTSKALTPSRRIPALPRPATSTATMFPTVKFTAQRTFDVSFSARSEATGGYQRIDVRQRHVIPASGPAADAFGRTRFDRLSWCAPACAKDFAGVPFGTDRAASTVLLWPDRPATDKADQRIPDRINPAPSTLSTPNSLTPVGSPPEPPRCALLVREHRRTSHGTDVISPASGTRMRILAPFPVSPWPAPVRRSTCPQRS
jgi:hypothetical protein